MIILNNEFNEKLNKIEINDKLIKQLSKEIEENQNNDYEIVKYKSIGDWSYKLDKSIEYNCIDLPNKIKLDKDNIDNYLTISNSKLKKDRNNLLYVFSRINEYEYSENFYQGLISQKNTGKILNAVCCISEFDNSLIFIINENDLSE